MPSATTGAVSAVRDFGSFLSCVFHKSCNPETFLTLRVSSPNAQPERCGSCPKVGQSAPQSAPQLRNKKLIVHIKVSVFERSEVISGIHEFGSRRGDPLLPRKLLGALYGGCCNFRKASHCLPRESFLAGLPVSLSKFVKDGFGIGLHRSGFQKRDCLRCLSIPQVGQSQRCLRRQAAWREGNCPLEISDGVPYPSQAKQCITKLEI